MITRIATWVEIDDEEKVVSMDSDLREMTELYASRRGLVVGPRLGSGIQVTVFRARFHHWPAEIAVKFLADAGPFHGEVSAYERLAEHGITDILGFNVPQILHVVDAFLAIEMTTVARRNRHRE